MSKRDRGIPSSYFDSEEDLQLRRQSKQATPSFNEFMKSKKKESSRPPRDLSTLDTIAIAITIVLMAFWTLVILGMTLSTRDPITFMIAVIGALLGLCIMWDGSSTGF